VALRRNDHHVIRDPPHSRVAIDTAGIVPMQRRMNTVVFALAAALLALSPLGVAAQTALDPSIDWAHLQDPLITIPPAIVEWSEDLPRLWHKALQHPEADAQREAADSITRAHQLGMPVSPSLAKDLVAALTEVLEQPKQHPVTRTAAARALVQLDARGGAALLAQARRHWSD
jgi:hypothetical protein